VVNLPANVRPIFYLEKFQKICSSPIFLNFLWPILAYFFLRNIFHFSAPFFPGGNNLPFCLERNDWAYSQYYQAVEAL